MEARTLWLQVVFVMLVALLASKDLEAVSAYFDVLGARERAESGEKALELYRSHAESSVCWRGAVARLDVGCRDLSDFSQSKLAIAFANCHLEKSEKKTYPCPEEATVADCTRNMDVIAFQAYTEFFTHTGHICFFLQSQLWQESTELAVSRLTENSESVSQKLQESLGYHRQLLEYEKLSLDNQQVLMTADKELKESLLNSTERLQGAFKDMNQTSYEVFGDFFVMLKKIAAFQSLALGEFMSIKTIVFYMSGVILAYILTATPQTKRAFLGVFISRKNASANELETMHWLNGWLRSFCVLACLSVMVYKVLMYRDYAYENNSMLNSIKADIERMKTAILKVQEPVVTMALPDSSTAMSPDAYPRLSATANTCLSAQQSSHANQPFPISLVNSNLNDSIDSVDGTTSSDEEDSLQDTDDTEGSASGSSTVQHINSTKRNETSSVITPKPLRSHLTQSTTGSTGRYNLRVRCSETGRVVGSAPEKNSDAELLQPLTLKDVKRRLYDVANNVQNCFQETVAKLAPAGSQMNIHEGRKGRISKSSKSGAIMSSTVHFSDGEY
ncbi:uncharacterized protein LOC134196388 isoform X2 [Corticium candelabrum]|uniref:uncharacterized protein LOC134196388 isoform X2 n=1 Tax=Corticium candelabrum TaxID=121492 RepID=UPI002E26BF17|nr:uncharacterized protein LOC134196388 isoform X2 [Corticium candelabrum]